MPDCSCKKCIKCCERKPGWFAPGEVERAAALLNLSLEAFFSEYLVIDFWYRIEGDILILAPKQVGQDGGRRLSFSDGFRAAPCIFLTEEKKCRIHAAKPFECRVTMGCDDDHHLNWHEDAAMAWDNAEAQEQIKELEV